MQNVRCGHKQRRQRCGDCGLLQTIEEGRQRGGRGAAEGGSEEGSSHCDCDSVAHPDADADCDCVWNPSPFPPAVYRGSIKTQQFADFLFSSLALLSTLTSTSQPSSPSPSPPLFIHNVNTDEKLLNHCNTKPTQSHCTYSSTVPTPAPTPTPTATQTPVPVPAPTAADAAAPRAAMIYAAQILEIQSVYAKYWYAAICTHTHTYTHTLRHRHMHMHIVPYIVYLYIASAFNNGLRCLRHDLLTGRGRAKASKLQFTRNFAAFSPTVGREQGRERERERERCLWPLSPQTGLTHLSPLSTL